MRRIDAQRRKEGDGCAFPQPPPADGNRRHGNQNHTLDDDRSLPQPYARQAPPRKEKGSDVSDIRTDEQQRDPEQKPGRPHASRKCAQQRDDRSSPVREPTRPATSSYQDRGCRACEDSGGSQKNARVPMSEDCATAAAATIVTPTNRSPTPRSITTRMNAPWVDTPAS
jgi:hypothetical protein